MIFYICIVFKMFPFLTFRYTETMSLNNTTNDNNMYLTNMTATDTSNATKHLACNSSEYEVSYEMYKDFAYWTDYIIQSVIGLAGIAANTIAIPVLCSREMNSIFNRLLMLLAIFDNFFIICQMLEGKRKMTNHGMLEEFQFNQTHEYAFGYFLYPFHAFTLCVSIYITVALALERYRAVWRPVEYHNKCRGANPWKRVMVSYFLPVIAFSVLFNVPKCFEIEFTNMGPRQTISSEDSNNETFIDPGNLTMATPTSIRLNDIYVVVYANLGKLFVQGIIPFASLCFLNYRIHWVMKRRRQLMNRPNPKPDKTTQNSENKTEGAPILNHQTGHNGIGKSENASSAQRKANEAQQAIVLFIIVFFLFVCHTPRFIINIHEFLNLDLLKKSLESSCDSFPVWPLVSTSVSNCLMTLNSSSNFYIYCCMCSTFRSILLRWLRRFFKLLPCGFCSKILHMRDNPVMNDHLPPTTTAVFPTRNTTNIEMTTKTTPEHQNNSKDTHHDNRLENNPDMISQANID